MSPEQPEDPGTGERPAEPGAPAVDPFSLEDPEARAREERRLERERRRREGKGGRGGSGVLRSPFGRRRRADGDGVPAAGTGESDAVAEQHHTPTGEHALPTPGEHAIPTPGEQTAVQRARAGVRRRMARRPPAGAIRRRRVVAAAVLVVGVVFAWFVLAFFQPFGGDGHGKNVVKIPEGAAASQVGQILESKGVISGGTPLVSGASVFRARLALSGKSDDIQSGTYTLATGMSYGAAIDALTGAASEQGKTVVIPEGYTRLQIAEIAKDAGVKGSYKDATIHSKKLDPKEYGAGDPPNLEGFLFPATYEVKRNAKAKQLVNQQLAEFKREIKKVDLKYAKSKNLSTYDVLIIASMIDREVQIPKERKKVAEVIYNRLSTGEPLFIDATIRYAVKNYDKQLTESELNVDSPYNTRLNAGLPPTPIGNPGLAAIKAAAKPGRGDLRFYVVKPGTCGEHFFTGSEDEFNKAADAYKKALEKQGNSPTKCK